MNRNLLLLIFLASINYKIGAASILDWVWRTQADDTTVLVADGVPLISVPYESMTEDEKFLQEAAKFTNMQVSSPLEICQHKVIIKIKTSCSDVTEEELAKLGVNLLNCQSLVEGRRIFPCTEEMSIKQCTTDMDADMWNAYHLMSNRARAVCYAVRSTHFRALTELTVNKLMQSTHTQIEALDHLKQSQNHLEERTLEAISSLSQGNKALLEQQQYLKDAQATAHKLVTTNLRELSNEKALIRSGYTQLAAMAEDIKNKLDKAHKDLEQQAIERGDNHREVLQDLISIQEQARLIWERVEYSTNRILDQHEETIKQYEQTLQKLTQINDTIQYIWNLTNIMRTELDEKLGWITDYIGDTGEQVQKIYRIFLHAVYILVAMIVAAFLQAPFLTRATIIGIVPVNLVGYLKNGMEASLDFMSMTVLIILITGMHFVMLGIQRFFGPGGSNKRTEPVNMVYPNGHSNGNAHEYTSSSYSNFMRPRLHIRLIRKVQELYSTVISQINYGIGKISAMIQSITSATPQNLAAHEQLSCSYVSSKKNREDIVYEGDYSNMISDDDIDYDSVNVSSRDGYRDDINDLIDIFELTHRPRMENTSISRSVTPSYTSPKIVCAGITQNGRRCRAFSLSGRNYCRRHITGTSIVDEHID